MFPLGLLTQKYSACSKCLLLCNYKTVNETLATIQTLTTHRMAVYTAKLAMVSCNCSKDYTNEMQCNKLVQGN